MSKGTREQWLAAREQLLVREKELTKLGDEVARQRLELPWVAVEKAYRFETIDGPRTLEQLFGGHSQLLIYHFMFGPSFEAGCTVCSSIADTFNGALPHLGARDAATALLSHAPLAKLQAYKQRMGWSIPWVSAGENGFSGDFDFGRTPEQTRELLGPALESSQGVPIASDFARRSGTDVVSYLTERPGFLAFAIEDGTVYHTYSTTARGLEFLMSYYAILDRAPHGRDEHKPSFQTWLRRHDEYLTA
jgi:predicted dithiol-disulfide oxidoreductase (DUF899 family)